LRRACRPNSSAPACSEAVATFALVVTILGGLRFAPQSILWLVESLRGPERKGHSKPTLGHVSRNRIPPRRLVSRRHPPRSRRSPSLEPDRHSMRPQQPPC
jgi:hypothetical protein